MDVIMAFLDTETYEEKYELLPAIEEHLSDYVIDTLAVSMDITIPDGNLENRLDNLRDCINTFRRFEVHRK